MSAIRCSCVYSPLEYSSRLWFLKPISGSPRLNYARSSPLRRIEVVARVDSCKLSFTYTASHFRDPSHCSCASRVAASIPRAPMESDGNGAENGNGLIDPSIAEVIVVRHGETEWNALGKLQGHLDVDLNDAGREQAVAVAERLSGEPNISAIYSSDLKRAFETAQTIAAKHGGVEVIADKDLRERNLGDLQGLVNKPEEIMKVKPVAYQALLSPNMDQEIPGGGESLNQLYRRCTSTLERIGKKHKGERVIVVTHGGVLRSLYRRAATKGRSGKILNTSVGVIHLSDDGETWTIKSWNDISHIKETGFLKSGFGGDSTSG